MEEYEHGKWATANHESAHIVLAVARYKHEGIPVNFLVEREKDRIISITIVKVDGSWVGQVITNFGNEPLSCDNLTPERQSWNIVRLLAGYATEFSYGLTVPKDVVLLDAIGKEEVAILLSKYRDLDYPPDCMHDFGKVFTCLDFVFRHGRGENKFSGKNAEFFDRLIVDNFMMYWKKTVEIVAHKPVCESITKLAELLMKKGSLTEEEIDEQTKINFGVDELKSYLIPLPTMYLPDPEDQL